MRRRSNNLTRREAAVRLGISQTTLRRREKSGVIPHILEGKVHVFDPVVVESLAADPKSMAKTFEIKDGAEAADVFTKYDAGLSPAEVVKELRITPARAESLRVQWARSHGGMFVEARHLAIINELTLLADHYPISTGDDLVVALKDAFEALGNCRKCGWDVPDFCARCAARIAKSRKMRARAAAKERLARLRAEWGR